jgi:hypothetical protein
MSVTKYKVSKSGEGERQRESGIEEEREIGAFVFIGDEVSYPRSATNFSSSSASSRRNNERSLYIEIKHSPIAAAAFSRARGLSQPWVRLVQTAEDKAQLAQYE